MPAPDPARVAAALGTLRDLLHAPDWPADDSAVTELVRLAARLAARDRKETRAAVLARDRSLKAAPPAGRAAPLARPAGCPTCGATFTELHPRYASFCPACAADNAARRDRTADLTGRTALVTGGRVRSGFHAALKLLRAGADVVATTRFPADAARRFAAEPDAADWSGRLRLVPLDLRLLRDVEQFAGSLTRSLPRLDVFIANAAQTVRRPPAYYRALAAAEDDPAALPPVARAWVAASPAPVSAARTPADLALVPLLPGDESADAFPAGALDAAGDPLDLRAANSWGLPQELVSTVELAEVHAVNALAPFVLLRGLRPLFRAGPDRDRFAVMVSASEGNFAAGHAGRHPHTNMAKAGLNMLVRTSAPELLGDRVHLTAVDPGWFSVQHAAPDAARFAAAGGRVPLDAVDAAARILAPVFDGIATGEPASGVLFKDYRVAPW